MSSRQHILHYVSAVLSRFKFPLTVGFIGFLCLAYGAVTSLLPKVKTAPDVVFTAGSESKAAAKTVSVERNIVLDINGAVVHPGVYTMPEESRLTDALKIAGGLAENADKEFVAKQFNLAMKLKDGMKIYIPAVGEGIVSSSVPQVAGASIGTQNNKQININTASSDELDSLSGIGKVTADKIISGRPYGSIEELTEKKIVKQSVFDKIKDQITAY